MKKESYKNTDYDGITLLDTKETAKLLHIKPITLSLWRHRNQYLDKDSKKYLPYLQIGSKVFYKKENVINFLKSCEITSVSCKNCNKSKKGK